MKATITTRNMTLSDNIRERIERKTDKMARYLTNDTEMFIQLTRERSGIRRAEVTVPMGNNVILRAEAAAPDNLFMAIDQALARIERQIHRHRTKLERNLRDTAFDTPVPEYMEDDVPEDTDPLVVRRKSYKIKPISVDDAALQMELLSHDFFAFVNAETEQVNIIYKRKDGGIGLLEPEE